MDRIHKRIGLGEATYSRTVNIGTIGGVCMTLAAIIRCGNMACRSRNHDYAVMRSTIMATCAIFGDSSCNMVEARHGKA